MYYLDEVSNIILSWLSTMIPFLLGFWIGMLVKERKKEVEV